MKNPSYYLLLIENAQQLLEQNSKGNRYALLPFFAKEIDTSIRFQDSKQGATVADAGGHTDKIIEAGSVLDAIKITRKELADMVRWVDSDEAEYFWKEYVKGVFFSQLGYTLAIYHPVYGTTFALAEPYPPNGIVETEMPINEYIAYRKEQLEGKYKEDRMIPEKKVYNQYADFDPESYLFKWNDSQKCYVLIPFLDKTNSTTISPDKKLLIANGKKYPLNFNSIHQEFHFFNAPSEWNKF